LAPGATVLDVGCGPGTITLELAALVAPATVVGIDMAEEVLAGAHRLPVAGGAGVAFAAGDVHRLPHPDGSFRVVHAHQVLQHLADPVGVLREMGRVCAEGGIVAARDADYAAMTWFPEVPGLARWANLYQRVTRRNGAEPDAGRRLLSWA